MSDDDEPERRLTEKEKVEELARERVTSKRLDRLIQRRAEELELEASIRHIPPKFREPIRNVLREYQKLNDPRTAFKGAMDRDDILAMKRRPYIIDKTIPTGSYTSVFGAPGDYKTTIGGMMVEAVRFGATLFKHYQAAKAPCMFLAGEGNDQFRDHFLALDAYKRRNGNELSGRPAPCQWVDTPVNLMDIPVLVEFVYQLERLRQQAKSEMGLCLIDPDGLYRGSAAGDVENYEPLAMLLRAIAKALPQWAFVIIGHTEAQGKRHRGTDHIRMYAGTQIKVERQSRDQVVMIWEKIKFAEPQAIWLEVVPIEETGGIILQNIHNQQLTVSDYIAEKDSKFKTDTVVNQAKQAKSEVAEVKPTAPSVTADREKRVLDKLLDPPLKGRPLWTGNLLVEVLGNRNATLGAVKQLIAAGEVVKAGRGVRLATDDEKAAITAALSADGDDDDNDA